MKKSMDFYTQVGFTNNPQFTDQTGACMALSEEIFVMLLTHEKFYELTKKKIADSKTTVSVVNSINVESKDVLNSMVAKAVAAGGRQPHEPEDYGFMLSSGFEDLDGHLWGVNYMDLTKLPQQ